MKILVLNAGSSSLKYAVLEMPSGVCCVQGLIDNIGSHATHSYQIGTHTQQQAVSVLSYQSAFECMLQTLAAAQLKIVELDAIAHRVVHGGEDFQAPTRIYPPELARLKALNPLAPLHNPANVLGIETTLHLAPTVAQFAIFDTAFHHSLPDYAYRYPLPEAWYQDYALRRYGFHGTSHFYVAKQAALLLQKPLAELNLISLHLGNGASACAIQRGKSVDTSMGFSPQAGLMMGTRCGDIDSSLLAYLVEHTDLSSAEIDTFLNKNSGLKGVAGTQDMREIHRLIAEDNGSAKRAFAMFCYRIKKYIGAYFAVLGQVDALIFTGGIGENDPQVREQSCANLQRLGIMLDSTRNHQANSESGFIQHPDSETAILIIKTNETLEMAQQVYEIFTTEKNRVG